MPKAKAPTIESQIAAVQMEIEEFQESIAKLKTELAELNQRPPEQHDDPEAIAQAAYLAAQQQAEAQVIRAGIQMALEQSEAALSLRRQQLAELNAQLIAQHRAARLDEANRELSKVAADLLDLGEAIEERYWQLKRLHQEYADLNLVKFHFQLVPQLQQLRGQWALGSRGVDLFGAELAQARTEKAQQQAQRRERERNRDRRMQLEIERADLKLRRERMEVHIDAIRGQVAEGEVWMRNFCIQTQGQNLRYVPAAQRQLDENRDKLNEAVSRLEEMDRQMAELNAQISELPQMGEAIEVEVSV